MCALPTSYTVTTAKDESQGSVRKINNLLRQILTLATFMTIAGLGSDCSLRGCSSQAANMQLNVRLHEQQAACHHSKKVMFLLSSTEAA